MPSSIILNLLLNLLLLAAEFVQHLSHQGNTGSSCTFAPMLTTASITTETFSAALLGLEDLSLRVTAAALHVAANPEKHPRLRLMLADLSEVMQCCEEDLGLYQQ